MEQLARPATKAATKAALQQAKALTKAAATVAKKEVETGAATAVPAALALVAAPTPAAEPGAPALAAEPAKRPLPPLLAAALSSRTVKRRPSAPATTTPGANTVQMVREKAEADDIPDFPPLGVTKNPEGTAIMLSTFANDMVRKLSQQAMAGLKQHLELFPSALRLGSACSGTDIWFNVVQEVLSALSEQMATS